MPESFSSSLQSSASYPDPADEDVLSEQPARPSYPSIRLPSYTNFISSRTFSPEGQAESRWTFGKLSTDSPLARVPSEGTTNNEDWRTASNGSLDDNHSRRSVSRSQSRNGRRVIDHTTLAEPASWRVTSRMQSHVNLRNGSSGHADAANAFSEPRQAYAESYSSPVLSQKLSNDNLRKQERLFEDDMRTPQPNQYRQRSIELSHSHGSSTDTKVLSELNDLKRRIDILELGPRFAPGTSAPRARLNGRTISKTGDFSSNHAKPQASTQLSPAVNHHSLLQESMNSLRTSSLPQDLIRPLNSAVSDALALSTEHAEIVARSRLDSLCHSLTAVCLYLQYHTLPLATSQDDEMIAEQPISRAAGPGYARGKSASVANDDSQSRRRSTRKSLAEILHPEKDNLDWSPGHVSERSASRLSRIRDDRMSRSPRSDIGESYKSPTSREMYSRASMFADLNHRNRYSRITKSEDPDWHKPSFSESIRSTNGRSHVRTSSQAVSEILERSPITREGLHARYHRNTAG